MDNQKKPSKYGTLYHKPEHYERLWMLESSRKPEYLTNTFEADNERAGGMQLRRIAFDELQNKGYFKDRKYEEITPNEAMAGAMKYSSIIADNYGLTNEYWNALAFKEGPTAIKALYDKHGGNLKKAMGDPALRTEGREYLTKYLKTKLSDQINEKPAYVKDMYKVILEGGDINSVDPKKYYVSPTVKKAQAGLETKKEDNGFELNKMLTMPGMTKYTAGMSPVASAMANSIGLNGQTKGDLLGGAGMGALSGFLSGGPLGAILGGAGSLLTYGSNMAAKQLAEKEGREAEIKSKTIPGREGMEMPLMYGQMGGNVPTTADTLALQQNAVAIQNAVLKMHGTENFPVANRTINPNKDGSHVDDLDIPMGPQRDGEKTIIPIDKNKYYMKDAGLPDSYPPTLIDKRIAPNSIQHIFYPPTLGKPGQYDPRDDGKRVYIVPNYDYKQQQGGEVVPRLLNNFIKKYSGGGFSTEGYRSDSPDVDNAMNIIPGGNISMKDVNFPVTAYPMSNGQIQGPYTMTPNKEYNFSTADAVIEIPEAQMGKPVTRDTIFPNASNKALFDMYSKGDNRPKYIINESQEGTSDELSTLEKGLKYADDIMSAPSRGMVKLITGKYQDPSEAWGYENPQGFLQNAANFALDVGFDPANALGLGVAKNVLIKAGPKLLKVGKAADIADKTGLIIKTSKVAAKEYMKDPKNLKDLYSNKYLDADKFKKFTEMAYKEMPEIQTTVNKTLKLNKPGATTALVNDVIDIKKGKAGYNKNTPVYEDQGWGPLASGYKNAVPTVSKGIKKKVNKISKPSIIKQAVINVENKVAEEKQIVIPQHSKMVNGQRIPITEKEANEIMSKGKVSTAPGQTIKEKDRKNVYIKPLQQGGYVQGETYELDDKEIKRLLSLGYQIQ